ncbi:MAG: glycosyltransferase [Bacteroidota bacterium]
MPEASSNLEALNNFHPIALDPVYQKWLKKNYPNSAELEKMAQAVEAFEYQPNISVITPVYNTDATFLEEAIQSVLAQIYPHWQLCLADDASTDGHVREILERYSAINSPEAISKAELDAAEICPFCFR